MIFLTIMFDNFDYFIYLYSNFFYILVILNFGLNFTFKIYYFIQIVFDNFLIFAKF